MNFARNESKCIKNVMEESGRKEDYLGLRKYIFLTEYYKVKNIRIKMLNNKMGVGVGSNVQNSPS